MDLAEVMMSAAGTSSCWVLLQVSQLMSPLLCSPEDSGSINPRLDYTDLETAFSSPPLQVQLRQFSSLAK